MTIESFYDSNNVMKSQCAQFRCKRAKKWLVKAYMVKVGVVVVTRFTAPSPYITQLLPFVI